MASMMVVSHLYHHRRSHLKPGDAVGSWGPHTGQKCSLQPAPREAWLQNQPWIQSPPCRSGVYRPKASVTRTPAQ